MIGDRTLMLLLLYSGAILTLIMSVFAATQKARRGEWYWAGSYASLTVSLGLFLLPFSIPVFISVVTANFLLIVGLVLLDAGLRTFELKSLPWKVYLPLILLQLSAMILFTYVFPLAPARTVVISLCSALFYAAISARLFKGFPEMPRAIPAVLAIVFAGAAIFYAARILTAFINPGSDPLHGNVPGFVPLTLYVLAAGAWTGGTAGFIVMKNQVLYGKLEEELDERRSVQASLERHAERLRAFHGIYHLILEARPIETIASHAVEKLGTFGMEGSAVVLVDSKTKSATVLASGFTSLTREPPSGVALDPRLFRKPAEGPEYIALAAEERESAEGLQRLLGVEGIDGFFAFPIEAQGETIGILCVEGESAKAFEGEKAEIASEIADLIGLAIHNHRIRESLIAYTRNLETSLKEKEVLFREVHHRVKNNLQVISSLLYLQSTVAVGKEIQEALTLIQNRIRSITFVHEKLYKSKDMDRVSFTDYVREFTEQLFLSFGVDGERISCIVGRSDVLLDADIAVPFGLIINELVSNSLKYAFPGGRKGTIRIDVESDDPGFLTLTVRDDGVGFPADFDLRKSRNMGMQIVEVLSKQMGATPDIQGTNGVTCTLRIPRKEP